MLIKTTVTLRTSLKMPPYSESRPQTSFPELVYPSLRDGGLKTHDRWLKGKSMDDGAEGLWRIHDKLYDFTDFIKRHPGGEMWLRCTKGTDITEAFETHHISLLPEKMLAKFYARDALSKRNSPFTFQEDGFYRTLKRRVREVLAEIPKSEMEKSKRINEALLIGMFTFGVLACNVESNFAKMFWCVLTSIFMTWTVICSHNFTHQKDNWRMYLYNFGFMPSRVWRVTHGLSHHLYTNTLMDYEISVFEPYFIWMPSKKRNFINKYMSRIYAVIIYTLVSDVHIITRFITAFVYKDKSAFEWEDAIPLSLPIAMYSLGKCGFVETLILWTIIYHLESFLFHLIGLNAAHHHPDVFHDGDDPKEDRDWGIHQLYAVMDRVDINGSLFKVLTNFGDHGLHHMFPTFDHAILCHLYPVFLKTCKEFSTELRMGTQLEAIIGQFQQLSRTTSIKNRRCK